MTLRSPVWRPRPTLIRLTIDPLEHALQSLGRAMETPACCDVFDLDDTASSLAHSVNRLHAEAVSHCLLRSGSPLHLNTVPGGAARLRPEPKPARIHNMMMDAGRPRPPLRESQQQKYAIPPVPASLPAPPEPEGEQDRAREKGNDEEGLDQVIELHGAII